MILPVNDPELRQTMIRQAYWEFSQSDASKIIVESLEDEFDQIPFDSTNPHGTSFRCGCMNVVRHIRVQIAEAGQPTPGQDPSHE